MRKIIFWAPVPVVIILVLQVVKIDKATMARGKKVYTNYCISCHQPDGGGVPNLNPPLEKNASCPG